MRRPLAVLAVALGLAALVAPAAGQWGDSTSVFRTDDAWQQLADNWLLGESASVGVQEGKTGSDSGSVTEGAGVDIGDAGDCPVATAGALDGPDPWSGCWPGPQTTGLTDAGSLVTVASTVTLSVDGTVYTNRFLNGVCLEITADNVTVRNVKILMPNTGCSNAICNIPVQCGANDGGSNTGLLVENVEIDCGGGTRTGRTVIGTENYTARKVYAHGSCENTFWCETCVIEDTFCDEPMDYIQATDPHTDCVQVPDGSANVTLRHNTIYGNFNHGDDPGIPGDDEADFGSSAVGVAENPGQSLHGDILVTRNLVAGGGYTLSCPIANTGTSTYTDNHFSTVFTGTPAGGNNAWTLVGGFGPIYSTCPGITTWTGNVYHDGPLAGQSVG